MEQMKKSDMQEIIKKLAKLQEDVDYLKENMINVDSIMTKEDEKYFEEYEKQKREGRLISGEQLKKELVL